MKKMRAIGLARLEDCQLYDVQHFYTRFDGLKKMIEQSIAKSALSGLQVFMHWFYSETIFMAFCNF